jgi:PAS domain S-box-containing protein
MEKISFRNLLADWMEIQRSDPVSRWRGQLLSLFLLVSLPVAVLLFLVNFHLWLRFGLPEKFTFAWLNLFGVVLICVLWWINRKGRTRAASVLFILVASVLPFLSIPRADYETVLVAAAIPITLASFLTVPFGAFAALALQILLYSLSFLLSAVSADFNYFSVIAMGMLAFISWICASWFETTLARSRGLQDRLQMISENMVDVIGHINTHSILLYASPSVTKMFGWEPKDLEGHSVLENIHPDESEIILQQVQAAVARHLPTIRQEFRYRCIDGDFKWVESEIRLMYQPGGEFDSAIFGIRDISGRRQAEDALTREHNLLRTVIDNLPVAVYATDRQSRKILSNRMDWEIPAWSGRPDSEEATARLRNGDRRVLDGGEELLDEEVRITDSRGEMRTLLTSRLPLRDANDRIVGLVGIGTDVTRLKRAQEDLDRERRFFRAVIDASPNFICVRRKDGTFTLANKALAEVYRTVPEKMIGRKDADFPNPPLKIERMAESDLEVIAGQSPQTLPEEKVIDASGEERWFHINKVPLPEESGGCEQALCVAMDITDRKRAELALRESEEKYRCLVEFLPDGIFILKDDRIAFANQSLVRILRAGDAAAVAGRSAADFVLPASRARAAERITEILNGGRYHAIEGVFLGADGSPLDVELTAFPFTMSGEPAIIGVARDVTEQKKAAAEIHRLNAELERRVTERTAQLEAANKELEAFAYSVSHDLRAPLRSMDGFGQALQEDYGNLLDDQGQDYLQRIRSASRRMGLLIDDLLKLSRLTRSELHRQRLDLSEMAARVIEELRAVEPNRNVECRIAAKLAAQGDERLVSAVLENLIGNAWKFTARRKAAVIEFGSSVSPAGETVFFIRDNGAGFNMDHAGKLFLAFQRLHTVQEFPGNGIGLATVQRIIHRHGGRVWGEGEQEKGATFYFTLPA